MKTKVKSVVVTGGAVAVSIALLLVFAASNFQPEALNNMEAMDEIINSIFTAFN